MAVEKTRVSYVSSSWAGKSAGAIVYYDKNTPLTIGEDAFATLAAAINSNPSLLQVVVMEAKYTPSAADVSALKTVGAKKIELMSAPLTVTEKSGTTTSSSAVKNDFVKTGGITNVSLTGYKNVTVGDGKDLGLISAGALSNGYAGTEKETIKTSKTGDSITNDNKYTAAGVLDLTSTDAAGIAGYQKVTLKGSSWAIGYVRGGKITKKTTNSPQTNNESSSDQRTVNADGTLVASNGAIGDSSGIAIENFKTVNLTNMAVDGAVTATKVADKKSGKYTAASGKGQLKITDSPEDENYNFKRTMDGTLTLDKSSVHGSIDGFKTVTVQNGSSIEGSLHGADVNYTSSSKDEITYTGEKPEENPATWSQNFTRSFKYTSTGKGTLTVTSSSITSIDGMAKVTATNATLDSVINSKITQSDSDKLTSTGKGKVDTGTLTSAKETYSYSYQNASSGTFTATNSTFKKVSYYATATLSKSKGGDILGGTEKFTYTEELTKTATTVQGKITQTTTYTPGGTLTLSNASSAGYVDGFDKVTLTGNSSAGRVNRDTLVLDESYSFGAGALTVTSQVAMSGSKVVSTETASYSAKKGGTFTMTGGSVEKVLNYATVTITSGSVTGDISQDRTKNGTYTRKGTAASLSDWEAGNVTYSDWEETSETAATNGKITLTDTNVGGDIEGYATVTVKGTKGTATIGGSILGTSWTEETKKGVYAETYKASGKVELVNVNLEDDILGYATVNLTNVTGGNEEFGSWISGGNETWNTEEMTSFDLNGTLKGTNVSMANTTIEYFKTVTLTDSNVAAIDGVTEVAAKSAGKITLTNSSVQEIQGYKTLDVKNTAAGKDKEAGASVIGTFTGTSVADAVKFANGEVTVEEMAFGAGNDKLTIDKNTTATIGTLDWGDGADSLTLNGALFVETTSDLGSWQGVKYSGSGTLAVGTDELFNYLSTQNLGKIQLSKAIG